ncbi:hypothetical protein ACRQ1B_08940 [Rhizobium panacihumi]|uniref:hypothetical protein n=1 Tax=Rhizobium panacihumi TaxID=2008450 RepID=UPI003D7A2C57
MTRNLKKWVFAAGAMAIVVLVPELALAQTQTSPSVNNQDCAAPADPSQKSDRVPKEGENLSRKLDDCKGVLKAPEAGDRGIVAPAPETGNTRVIKPDDVPDNANPSNGSGG